MKENLFKMSQKCLLGCASEYPDDKKENIQRSNAFTSLFKAPQDSLVINKWNVALQSSNNPCITSKDYLCNLHFNESDIIRVYKTLNGKCTALYRLKKDAVPCIFDAKVQESNTSQDWMQSKDIVEENKMNSKLYNINRLKDDLESKRLPLGWVYNPNKEGVLFALLDFSDLSVVMMCAINNDMSVNLLVSDRVLTTNFRKKPKTFEDIVKYLVSKRESICTGTNMKNTRSDKCCGFLMNTDVKKAEKQRCSSCKKLREKLLKKKISVCWLAEKKNQYAMKAAKQRSIRQQRQANST